MGLIQYLPDEDGVNYYLRRDGHSISDSINEIIDNARDQGASEIKFNLIEMSGRNFLAISNNGNPISNWESFITLGGESLRGNASIGHYGVGLKQFLSLFKHHTIFSKQNKKIEIRHKVKNKKKDHFYYSDLLETSSPEFKICQKILTSQKGILIVVELDSKQRSQWEDIEIYNQSAQSYYFCPEINIFFDNKKVIKKHPFGKAKLEKTIKDKDYPGIAIKYYIVDPDSVTQDRRGAYVLFNGRLINNMGKYWFNHAEYNGHLLIIEVDNWRNKVLTNESLTIVHQKNDFSINKQSPFYNKISSVVKKIQSGVLTSNKKINLLKEKVKNKKVTNSIPLNKGFVKADNGIITKKGSNEVQGVEMSVKELENYLDTEFGCNLRKIYGHEHKVESGRYFKPKKQLDLVFKFVKNLESELKSLLYDLNVLESFGKAYKLDVSIYVCFPKSEQTSEIRKIRSRLEEQGIKFV